jgi:hypothetical protein
MTTRAPSITAPRTSGGPSIIPTGPKKILVDEQWVLALRRFARKALEHAQYALTELEEKHAPPFRHAKGCAGEGDDDARCLPKCPDRETRATLKCIRARLHDLVEQAPIRKFGADEEYHFPTRDGYTALVVEIEYLRERLAELDPASAPRIGAPEIVKQASPDPSSPERRTGIERGVQDTGPAPGPHSLIQPATAVEAP